MELRHETVLSSTQVSPAALPNLARELKRRIRTRTAKTGIIGLGYVGLPLAVEMAKTGFQVTGIDLSQEKVNALNRGVSYIPDVPSQTVESFVAADRLRATQSLAAVGELDTINICVPTPLRKNKDPELSYIIAAVEVIRNHIRAGQLIILESTTYPGTTREVVLPILEESGLKAGSDFFLAYSPERVDPGNSLFHTQNIPKVVGGITPRCAETAVFFYRQYIDNVFSVSSTDCAEMVKLLENTFRSVNIALANEMALTCHSFGINVWEVIEAAKTKPFGFMPFYPGPGIGGHCIQIDPYYLDWFAKSYDFQTKFIEIAAEINEDMPFYVCELVYKVMANSNVNLQDANVLILGVSFKKDVDDVRNSPAMKLLEILTLGGVKNLYYHDPFVKSLKVADKIFRTQELNEKLLKDSDCVVIVTDHSTYDYEWIVTYSKRVVDTRNATKKIKNNREKITVLGNSVKE